AVRPVQAVARAALPGEVRVAQAAPPPGARALRGDAPVQRPLRLLRLLEDAGRRPGARGEELRRRGAPLRPDARDLHGRRAAAPPRPRGPRGRGERGDPAQVHHAHHPRRDAHARARALPLGRGDQPVQRVARLPGRAARRGARHPRAHRQDLRERGGDARGRDRQHPLQHGHQGRQLRPADADRAARRGAGVRGQLLRVHQLQERQRRAPRARPAVRRARRRGARAARLQAAPARRDHELGLLPGADPALRPRRDDGAVPQRDRHHPRGPDGARAPLPRLPHRLPLDAVLALRAGELQRVLLRVPGRGAGAAAPLAGARRDGV
ncbi:MAG: hypothetical protein AVDCRST_MAG40-2114, partial [uncultured Gemmatimonadaceae bacterium]